MSEKDEKLLTEKLLYGLKISERRMLKEKAIHGQDIVVSSDDNTIKRIPASVALAALSK